MSPAIRGRWKLTRRAPSAGSRRCAPRSSTRRSPVTGAASLTRAAKMEDHVMKHPLTSITIVAALAIATPALAQRTGPGPFAETGTGPGVVPPGGAGSLLSAPQSAGWVSRSIHRGAVGGRAAAVLHPASALLCPAGRLLPAVRLLCPARPRLLRSAARLLLWAAGTVTRKSRLAGEPKDPGTACPSRVSST